MKKKVDVIIKTNNFTKAIKGSIINVARGYAFNYLIPNKIAEVATNKKVKHIKMFESIKTKEEKAKQIKNKLLQNSIEKITSISIYKKKGENNLIFGSITEKDIMKWVSKNTNILINKTQIKTSDVKYIGKYEIKIEISSQISIKIPLNIIPTNI
uniref:Large ribosomal subunit protein bL9c n=1 Tax=Periphykon beckeri TaxID=2006982 RepID=A0A1Z1M3Y0_9FLOR|nr:ribosomal protein L9 [Periphykon beckeri]ARW60485.1 ribosomal protein L9 [Periphykon beckeri]